MVKRKASDQAPAPSKRGRADPTCPGSIEKALQAMATRAEVEGAAREAGVPLYEPAPDPPGEGSRRGS